MDKVHKPSDNNCYAHLSETFWASSHTNVCKYLHTSSNIGRGHTHMHI
jgi:hypothetical protein